MFYLSAIIFGLGHVYNFNLNVNFELAVPIMIPFTFSGFIYGFAGMKYGMWANIFLHMSSNVLIFLLGKDFYS